MTKAWKERLPFLQSSDYTLQLLQAVPHLLPVPSTITSPCRSPSLIRYNPVGVFQHKPDPWPRADFTLLCKRQILCTSAPSPYPYLIVITFITVWVCRISTWWKVPYTFRQVSLLHSTTCCLRTISKRDMRLHDQFISFMPFIWLILIVLF